MTLEYLLSVVCLVLDTILVALMVRSRAFRAFAFFFSYVVWHLCSCATGLALEPILSPFAYIRFCLAVMVLEALFECGFLAELARSVLRHNPAVPPRPFLGIQIFLLAILFIASLSGWAVPQNLPTLYKLFLHLQQAFAILSIACVLTLVVWSSQLYLRWSERELRIVTGVAFYSIVTLAVCIIQTHLTVGPLYFLLLYIMIASALWAQLYWILTFASKDPEPQTSLTTNALIADRRERNRKNHTSRVGEIQTHQASLEGVPFHNLKTPSAELGGNLSFALKFQPSVPSEPASTLPFDAFSQLR